MLIFKSINYLIFLDTVIQYLLIFFLLQWSNKQNPIIFLKLFHHFSMFFIYYLLREPFPDLSVPVTA
jgi:hypothetical protein